MKKDWIPTEQAAVELGITPRQLRKLRLQGVFKAGKHYRKKNPIAARPTYVWHCDRCAKVLE
ncbi:hypothetical protein [Pseudanabaena sp. BC1403]|uniref:hypothetical protein n=1 Tax=Pseudanabaena sp. BC1403 TaxID=2043171 RepID=UPI000CD8072B|nr:hypothetical protein [Pseudanabaena sp. BC1403]